MSTETPLEYRDRLLSLVEGDAWSTLESTASRLRSLVLGRPLDVLKRQPAPGRWSVAEILAHLADAEIVAAWRFRTVLATDGVPLQAFDQDTWASAFKYAEADPVLSLELFDALRRGTVALLRRVDRGRYRHAGQHAERGPESVEHLIRLYAGHDVNHLRQIDALLAGAPLFTPAPIKEALTTPEALPDIRVGTILQAEPVAGSSKLAALTVDFGDHRRTIAAGLQQERQDLAALKGRQTLFLLNVAPRRMAGVESQGMLFDLGHADGLRPALAVPEFPMPDGTRAG
jgi:tRNA-binding EMAP/Myf-like protein